MDKVIHLAHHFIFLVAMKAFFLQEPESDALSIGMVGPVVGKEPQDVLSLRLKSGISTSSIKRGMLRTEFQEHPPGIFSTNEFRGGTLFAPK